LAQSAISQQIRRLESELGLEVFRRTSRSVELTAEGRVILGYAQRVLAEVDGLHSELEELTGLLRGQLRIGGVYPTGADELDCAFTALDPDTLGNEFAATLLWEDELIVALPAGHALCARPRVTFE